MSTVTIEDTATVAELKTHISTATGLAKFDLKIGYPPKPLNLDQFDGALSLSDTGIKLNGEQLLASEVDLARSLQKPLNDPPAAQAPVPIGQSARAQPTDSTRSKRSAPQALVAPRNVADSDPPEIPIPTKQGTLVLRVMPDDNSCLFRALSYAVLGSLDSMYELRSIVASTIQSQPEIYSTVVLEKPPDDYCRWIMREDSWGGAIELGILSQHFDIEICSINVQDLRIDRFNEAKRTRCILVYSGIHYDAIALNQSSPPYDKPNQGSERDQKVFDNDDDAILTGAVMLCRKLQERHYFTDTAGFTLVCGDCGWQGNGEKAAVEHAQNTGHYNLKESST